MANFYVIYSIRGISGGGGGGGSGTVTSVSVANANGLNGTVANPTTTPAITLSTTITGILQGNGTAISAATTGDLTDTGTDGITITGGTGAVLGSGTSLVQHVADTTHNGYLSSTDWNTFNGKGSGSVTSVSVTTANGVSGTVATATTTPAISLTLGAITPSSVAATGTVGGSNLSGTNTGDQTNITGNAGTVTTISGQVAAGTNVSLSGSGTTSSPYTISSSNPGGTVTSVSSSGATGLTLTTTNATTTPAIALGGTLTIAGGGTGQTGASAAYNALSPMTTLGDIEYESAANTASRLAGNTTTTKKFLTQTGNGTISAAPGWNTIAGSDLPIVVPGTSAGAVSSSGVTGNTTGSAISTGFVGELAFSTLGATAPSSSGSAFNIGTFTLSAGVWMIIATGQIVLPTSGNTYAIFDINTSSATLRAQYTMASTAAGLVGAQVTTYPFTIALSASTAASTTFYGVGQMNYTTLGSGKMGMYVTALRIA
jgi:hypothetical protein